MRHSFNSPPKTIMEVYQMLPEGTLAELINGTIYMSPAPTVKHQRIVRDLAFQLSSFVEKSLVGEILFSPCDVYLDAYSNAIQPDIIFISQANSQIIQEDSTIHGVPDMLIEILSKGNSDHDLVTKKNLYEKFGVKEYWIINPETKEAIGYTLKDNAYLTCGQFEGQIISPLLKETFSF